VEEETARISLTAYPSCELSFSALSGLSAHVTRDSVAKTPCFLEHVLCGGDSGGDRLIRAWSGLRGRKQDRYCLVRIMGASHGGIRAPSQIRDQG
jgi:hypothetical protein